MQSFYLDKRAARQEHPINYLPILDQIQALSNERQQLWRCAHRDKFSPAWWKRHNRIEAIGKQLDRLWHLRRVELAGSQEWQTSEVDRMAADHYEDYRSRVGWYHLSDWRIEDESNPQRRYMSVAEGLRENQYSRYVERSPGGKHANKPNVGARARKRALQGMIQLN